MSGSHFCFLCKSGGFYVENDDCFFDCRGARAGITISIGIGKASRNRMPAWEGRRLELREWQVPPLPDCSVRPFAGANCPRRTPLKSVFFDCGEYGLKNQSDANNVTFFPSERFSSWLFWNCHNFGAIQQINRTFSGDYGHRSTPLSYRFHPSRHPCCGILD